MPEQVFGQIKDIVDSQILEILYDDKLESSTTFDTETIQMYKKYSAQE
jgi:hypothetical protein